MNCSSIAPSSNAMSLGSALQPKFMVNQELLIWQHARTSALTTRAACGTPMMRKTLSVFSSPAVQHLTQPASLANQGKGSVS